MSSALQGRVFERARAFAKLPEALQAQTRAVAEYLRTPAGRAASLGSTGSAVEGSTLVAALAAHLTETKAEDASTETAKKIAEALVLDGFLTPRKESAAVPDAVDVEREPLVVVDPVLVPSPVSVWSVKDGAIQAGELKQKKGGLLSKLRGGASSVYVVANDKSKSVTVFASDVAQQPLKSVDLSAGTVEFDATLTHGIKLSNALGHEVFATATKEMQDEWLNSFINAGATYREAFNVDVENVKSFYELKDYDMQRNEVSMDKYKGKVVLVVNVSSKCGLTPTNYPELAALDEKYRDQGLQILAFPCNQFASQEPGTHEEIMEFVKQYKCEFPFFEKSDVNGANARPVFTYLKAKLPGSFGNFVKWNFTKFLVDRNGQPFKRYAPKELPFSFEDDIKKLLATSSEAKAE